MDFKHQLALTILDKGLLAIVVLTAGFWLNKVLEQVKSENALRNALQTDLARARAEVERALRSEERGELVAFRVAVEEWEALLLTLVFDFAMLSPLEAKVEPLYEADKKLFLKVKLAVVKVGIYLRDEEVEQRLMAAVTQLRNTYYPLIGQAMPRLIDLQASLAPIDQKLAAFRESNFSNMAFAPTDKDRVEHASLQAQLTEEMRSFSKTLLDEYRGIAEQLVALKEAINRYIYRPIRKSALDAE
jgi:hypothetical protein